MDLRTEITIRPFVKKISLKDPVLLAGSCFSENIGSKLAINKFRVSVNPFGTLYNPHSIFNVLQESLKTNPNIEEADIILNQGTFRNFNFHSAVSHTGKPELIKLSAEKMKETGSFLKKANWVIISLGTAIVYEYKESGRIVANCHKIPTDRFNRKMLTTGEVVESFKNLYSALMPVNNMLNIILTVSPVRHLKEGFENNQVSKSILRLACDQIVTGFDNVLYFPAYEIMIDDLRDYRFYDKDMVHPNGLGIDYIWDKFCGSLIDEPAQNFMVEWNKILNAIHHRPFHPETREYRDFVAKTIQKLESLRGKVDVEEEIRKLSQNL